MKYKQLNDYELIYMVRENDEGSKDLIFQKYIPIINHYVSAFYQVNKYFGYDYEDFYQEAVLAFYNALSVFDERENTLFYTFVCLCIKRKLISFCKKISNQKSSLSLLDCVPLDDIELEDYKSNIDIIIKGRNIQDIIKDFLYTLPMDKACIFELKLNGYSYTEIGRLLDIPVSTAEFKNRTSIKKIRKLLRDYNDNVHFNRKKAI